MKNFEEEKQKYYEKILNNDSYTEFLTNNKEFKDKNILELLVMPKNMEELEFAEITYLYINDLIMFIKDSTNDNVKKIKREESEGLNLYIDLIKAVKLGMSEKEVKEAYLDKLDAKFMAKFFYEITTLSLNDSDGFKDYLLKECGFDSNDNVSLTQFKNCILKVNDIANKKNNINMIELDDKTKLKDYYDFVLEYHNLCVNGKMNSQDDFNQINNLELLRR